MNMSPKRTRSTTGGPADPTEEHHLRVGRPRAIRPNRWTGQRHALTGRPAVPDPPVAAPPRRPAPPRQRAKLIAALDAGDPHGKVCAAWLVAQQLMAAYADPDLAAGRAAAEEAITTAKTCPVPEIQPSRPHAHGVAGGVPRPL